jgi:FkbM family methyltransferase
MDLRELSWLRKAMLPIFARINPGDISIRHHHTGDPIKLHSFRHKGYWFYGRRRESETMQRFAVLIDPGSVVFEIGGHIGYVSVFFARLVGQAGSVHVFEPGPNNLPYLYENTRKHLNIAVHSVGAGRSPGVLPLYVEGLTGQNNSFVPEFAGLHDNEAAANVKARRSVVNTQIVTVDDVVNQTACVPGFVKVDVEGLEFEVIEGMERLVNERQPRLMVEVQLHHVDIFDFLASRNYLAFSPAGEPLAGPTELNLNTFFIHQSDAHGLECMRTPL